MEQFDINYLNTLFRNNEELKSYLEHAKKIILPSAKDKGCTTNYLLKVAKDEVFTLNREQYRHYTGKLFMKAKKAELSTYLSELIGDKPTGFTDDSLPAKEWLVDCIYSLDPNHPIFGITQNKVVRDLPKG